jgi:hypothetical protein
MKRLLAILTAIFALFGTSFAEDEYYIICEPDSYVNVRRTPKKAGEEIGQLYCGDRVLSDGKTRNGFIHCVDMSNEYGDGWVHSGYIVEDKPVIVDAYGITSPTGRVMARKWVNGKRQSWIKAGTRVRVLAVSDEWTLTVRGFVKSEFIEVKADE